MNDKNINANELKILDARKKFYVIKGRSHDSSNRVFKSAYITNSRLMGVVCLYIRWNTEPYDEGNILHQFFYYDFEEYGLDTYKSLFGRDSEELRKTEQTLIGGLGGEKVAISEKEACFLVKSYIDKNRALGLPLPAPATETDFILDRVVALTREENNALFEKICITIESEFELINYFLMRIFAKDFEAATTLSLSNVDLSLYEEPTVAAFCKNTISPKNSGFICESLLEAKGIYYIAISRVEISDLKISAFEKISFFKITHTEAAMMLARSEYISTYELYTDDFNFIQESFSDLMNYAIQSRHDDGTLFLIFNRDNAHVAEQTFLLNSDVFGMIYVSENGELLLASYEKSNISTMELLMGCAPLGEFTSLSGKYEFKEPILYEYIHSGFDFFEDFLEFLNE